MSLKRGSVFTIRKGLLKWLVISQFTISIILIFSTFTMRSQMRFIKEKDLGFDKENVVVVNTGQLRTTDDPWQHYQTVKSEFLKLSGIAGVTGTNASFARGWSRYGYKVEGKDYNAVTFLADEDYIPVLNLDLIKGRNFLQGSETDQKYSVIVNESLAKQHGWDDPVGKEIPWYETDKPIRVIGLIRDYHFSSLESEIAPMLLFMEPAMEPFLYTLAKLGPGDPAPKIAAMEQKWKELYPTKPFEWSFLDQDLQNQYASYRQWIAYMKYASGFAILIGCLGLFGLSRIISQNRIKEIGIRKVFGANVADILRLLNKEVLWMVLISGLIAVPLAAWIMNSWLEYFSVHIGLGWGIAALSVGLSLLIALITVSFQTIRSSLSNPIDSLRHE